MSPKPYPIFGIVVAFAVGIVLSSIFSIASSLLLYSCLALFLGAVLYLSFAPKIWFRKAVFVQGLLVYALFVLLGVLREHQVNPKTTTGHIIHWHDTLAVDYYLAWAQTNLESTANSRRATLTVEKALINGEWQAVEGQLIAYFPKNDSIFHLDYGEQLLIRGKPREVPAPANPHAFDYRAYLQTKGITHQQFLKEDTFVKTGNNEGNAWLSSSWKVRNWAAQQFQHYIPNAQSRAIILALVLGVKNELDNTLREAYAGAGAMHVLAVSGLHVGIIAGLLTLFFRPVAMYRKGRMLKGLVSLVLLWAYAFITGLSPSVMRAVTMFSIIVIGEMISRRGNIYNTLSLSALILLLYNPYMLYQVGFQLSFAAVAGIVWLYPFFSSWFTFRWRLANWAWELTSVSLAAQLATFMFGLLYFHQFPNYFFLSNLVVIPAATLMVSGGVALLCSTWVSFVATILGDLLSLIIVWVNHIIFLLNRLPNAVSENVYIDVFTALCLGGLVICLGKLFLRKEQKWLFPVLLISIIFSTWNIYQHHNKLSPKSIAIYKTYRHQNLAFFGNNQVTILVDSTLLTNEDQRNYTFNEDLLFRGLSVENIFYPLQKPPPYLSTYQVSEEFKLITWHGKTIGWLMSKPKGKQFPIAVDYLIVSNNAIFHIEDAAGIEFNQLVIDNTNGYKTNQNLLREADSLVIAVHSLQRDSFWEVRL